MHGTYNGRRARVSGFSTPVRSQNGVLSVPMPTADARVKCAMYLTFVGAAHVMSRGRQNENARRSVVFAHVDAFANLFIMRSIPLTAYPICSIW